VRNRSLVEYFLWGSVIALIVGAPFYAMLMAPVADGRDAVGYTVGRDFVNYWLGGRLALDGAAANLFDPQLYLQEVHQRFYADHPWMQFSYMPNVIPLLAIFGLFPYWPALALWSIAGVALFLLVSFKGSGVSGDARRNLMIAAIISPIIIVNLAFGQMGLFLAALFVGGLRLSDKRPLLAGVLIGLLTIKPQLGPLLAIYLLIERNWPAIASATATAILLGLASLAFGGVENWRAYFENIAPVQVELSNTFHGFYGYQTATIFGALRLLGTPLSLAWAIHGVVAIGVLTSAVYMLFANGVSKKIKILIMACAATLLPNYLLVYDLSILLAAALYAMDEIEELFGPIDRIFLALLWVMPFSLAVMIQLAGMPLVALLILGVYICVVTKALGARRSSSTAFIDQVASGGNI